MNLEARPASRSNARSLRFRIMRVVVPLILGTFLIVGLVRAVSIRDEARNTLLQEHRIELNAVSAALTNQLTAFGNQARQLAAARSARDFARSTQIGGMADASIADAQNRLLTDFTGLLQTANDLVALRYVTSTGAVWSEAILSAGIPVVNRGIRLGSLQNDPTVTAALTSFDDQATMGDVFFAPIDSDLIALDQTANLQPMLRFAAPVRPTGDSSTIAGAIVIDALAQPLLNSFMNNFGTVVSEQTGRQLLLVDRQNHLLAGIGADLFWTAQTDTIPLETNFPSLATFLSEQTESTLIAPVAGQLVSTREVSLGASGSPNWRIVISDDAAVMQGQADANALGLLAATLLVGGLVSGIIYAVLGRQLRPINALVEQVSSAGGAGKVEMPAAASDEVAQLLTAFEAMSERIETLQGEIQMQLSRYSRNLDIAARVGRETATIRDLDRLLNQAINLICQEFGFYHAQVFLLDDIGKDAVLVYSYGEIGRRMLEAGHKLAVGSQSVIGQVTATGMPVIVNDTTIREGSSHRFNPLLPETRAEMALPLQIGDRVIGALDVQSKQPDSFQPDEVQTFQLLADQIAIAIQNARLLVEARDRLEQIQTLNRQLTQEQWETADAAALLTGGFRYDLRTVERLDDVAAASAPAEGTLSVPIIVRGQTVGVLEATPDAGGFSEGDEAIVRAVAERVAIAIENRRLFLEAESERQTLRSILETLPAGVLVLDPVTFRPIQANEQAARLLGAAPDPEQPFDAAAYHFYRADSAEIYPNEDLPIVAAARDRQLASSDDVLVITPDGHRVNLLVNAAPIIDARGGVSAIVTAFQDITALRVLEMTLQENLIETFALYETTRTLAEAEDVDAVIDGVLAQLAEFEPSEAYLLLLDEQWQGVRVARTLTGIERPYILPGDLLDAQEANVIPDVGAAFINPESRAELEARQVGAFCSFPLRARTRREVPLGWIVMVFHEPKPEIADRVPFFSAIADSAAVSLENRNLFRSTELALQETAALYNATTSISRSRTLIELGEALSTALNNLSPDLYAAYVINEAETLELFNIDLDGPPAPFKALLAEHGLMTAEASFYVDDVKALAEPSSFERALLAHGNIRAVGLVPLRSKERTVGVLIAAYHKPRHFGSSDVRFLSTVADSASVVVDNILLFDQIQSTLQETSILYQASRALNDTDDAAGILSVVVNHLTNRPIRQAFIALLNGRDWRSEDAAARVVAGWRPEDGGIDLSGLVLNAETFPAWRLLAATDVVTIDDVTRERGVDSREAAALQELEMRSLSVLPLRVGARALGAIVVGAGEPYEYSDRDRRIYRSFAEQASLRLEASRLLAQTERRARQLATSAEVSRIASSILAIDELLPLLVDVIRAAFGYDHVQIFLMDEANEYAVLRASTGEAGQKLLSINHKLQRGSDSVIGQVTARAEPVIAADTADARFVHRPNPYLPNTRSEMAIPLILKGKVVGALDVQSNLPNAYDDDDVAVLTTVANQIAVALDNAQLFTQSQQRAGEMTFLFDVTASATASETLAEALNNVAQEISQSLEALSVSIYLPETYMDIHENTFIRLRPVALAGTDQPLSELSEIPLDDPNSAIASCARALQSMIVPDVSAQPDYLPVAQAARSAIIVPLASANQLIGLIAVESSRPAAYGEDTRTLLLTLAGTLSAIIQNQQLLEQVQRTNEQLRELDRLKSDFLANMSHELRTPLNSIIGFSRVILKGIDGPLTEMQEQDLSTIYNSGLHLLNLINDILDQAKIAAGKMDLQFDYFDMKTVIDGVRSIGIGLVKDKPIDIIVEIAPGLPLAYGDEFRTRQVLLNLISNAAKFTHEGSITIRTYAVIDDETGHPMVRTDVSDTGIGIDAKDLPLLFEAFRQVDSSLTRTVGGTGLGLPIAKSLIEMQGGQMFVESQVNVGSTFSVLVPTEPVISTAKGREAEAPENAPELPRLNSEIALEPAATKAKTNDGGNGALKNGGTDDTGVFGENAKDEIRGAAGAGKGRDALKTIETQKAAAPPKTGTSELKRPFADAPMARPPMPLKRQILLIEDDPAMVDQYRRSLQREGFDIFTASIPLEAEAMASGLHPTLIIMDVNFADGAGWQILQRLKGRDDTCDIPVIVVSLSREEERARDLDVFRFIRRPFLPEDLVQAVRDAERDSRIDRILIIDDQPESVRLLSQLLDEQGEFRVFSAQTGMDGIAMVARRRPDLIIIDLRMPDMDGFTVVEQLRNNPETATIPILVVTGDELSTAERQKLQDLDVIYKSEISTEAYRRFIDGVKMHLMSTNED
jgi:GAF domain-containing protein/CheY-like chemotaxis protein